MKKLVLVALGITLWASAFGGHTTVSGRMGNRSKNCAGLGLCTVETTKPGLSLMELQFDSNSQTLTLSFDINELALTQPDKAALLKDQGTFQMEETFKISAEISQQLGSNTAIVIPAGEYTMSQSGNVYTVTFQL